MEVLVAGMLAYHASKGHPRKVDKASITIKSEDGKLVGCAMVAFLYNGMEINSLWVDESMRGHGLGQKLMELAEAEGKEARSLPTLILLPEHQILRKLGYNYTASSKISPMAKNSFTTEKI
jgi:N-acetylglutamate synthase-like GNAT family acetyltransferase